MITTKMLTAECIITPSHTTHILVASLTPIIINIAMTTARTIPKTVLYKHRSASKHKYPNKHSNNF